MELFFFKSIKNTNLSDNGGKITKTPIPDNIKNNLFPDVTPDEVEEGITRYRKINLIPEFQLPYLRMYLSKDSKNPDSCLINTGNEEDTQAEAENYLRWKGSGTLKAAISAGEVPTLIVESENEGSGFNSLDMVSIKNGTTKEYVRVRSISWNGKIATLTLESNSFIDNNYPIGSYVSACIERGIIGINIIWLKEIIPSGVWSKRNNINRIRFIL